MMVQGNLAQNQFIELKTEFNKSNVAAIATGTETDPAAVFVIQVEGLDGEFISIGLFNGITQASASNLTGASQYGWTDVPGSIKVRVTRTDAAGGDGSVGFSVSYL